jgi:hypothetical protein
VRRSCVLFGVGVAAALLWAGGAWAAPVTGPTTLRFSERSGSFHFVDNPPLVTRTRGPSAGDIATLRNSLWKSGNKIGFLAAFCVGVPGGAAQCTGTFSLPNGTLSANAFMSGLEAPVVGVIVGGTGDFKGVHGNFRSVTRPGTHGNVQDDVVHLDV